MTDYIDIKNIDSVAGAVYFVVGRGTEGGPSDSYRLSVAGVKNSDWGDVSAVASNSGYSIGTIQVDLGQQGLRALGATDDRKLNPGEKTYVDAIIEQSSNYASKNGLKFTSDLDGLRKDLLSHGDGEGKHPSIHFIDTNTRDSINAWASSNEGKQWIHQNIDYPQVKSVTEKAVSLLDSYGKNIPEDRRFETICILAKTENQIPGKMAGYEKILKDGGNYDDILQHANKLSAAVKYYDGPKAAAIAEKYENEYASPGKKEVLDKAQAKVGSSTYDPSKEGSDPDIKEALKAIGESTRAHAHAVGHGTLKLGAHGAAVGALQADLGALGYTDAKGRSLQPDKDFGPGTKAAVEAFQRDNGLTPDGAAGPKTLQAIHSQRQADIQILGQHSPTTFPAGPATPNSGPGPDDPRNVLNTSHGLYSTLQRRVPEASQERLLQFTAACHTNGITADNLGTIHLDEKTKAMTFAASWPPGAVANVDLKQPPPAPQQSVQQVQAFDQQVQQKAQQAQPNVPVTPQPNAPIPGGR